MQNRKRDTDVQNRILGSVGKGEGGMFWENSIETCILSRVKQITSPGWMHETSARAWCMGRPRGIRWRGKWEGGSGWGILVNPWMIRVNVWQKPLQYCKVISLQLIKINEKNPIIHIFLLAHERALLEAQTAMNPPAKKIWVRSLGWEDSLKKGMATHSSILAWRIPLTEASGQLLYMGLQRIRHNWGTNTSQFH